MKKFLKLMVALVFVAIPCLLVFSACSCNIDSALVRFDLNGGKFNDIFKAEKDITSDSYSTAVNLNYYGGFSDGMPDEQDLEAPDGKVFAGWYIDKDCTPENYLTSYTWEVLANNIREKKGNTVYARWIDEGEKEILCELDGETFSYVNGTSNIVRITASTISDLPTTSDIKAVGKEEFNTWKVECNGHYYDFNEKAYKTNATNKSCSDVNSEAFGETMLSNFLNDTNVSYVLLRPGNTTEKPHLTVTLDMSESNGVYIKLAYDSGRFVGLTQNSNCLFGTVAGSETTIQDENGTNVYSKFSLSVIYDIEYSDLNAILPNADYLTKDITGMTWQFTVGDDDSGKDSYDFNETNWNAHRPARPADATNEITFKLVSKS